MEYLQRKISNTCLKRVEFYYTSDIICWKIDLTNPPKIDFLSGFIIIPQLLLLQYRQLPIPL